MGGVCKVIFMSNPTYIKLFWVVGCVVVLTILNPTETTYLLPGAKATQLMPNLCPERVPMTDMSCKSQTLTQGFFPHSPVTRYLPSSDQHRQVMDFLSGLMRWCCLLVSWLIRTTVHPAAYATVPKK